jgi:hypothetical protein
MEQIESIDNTAASIYVFQDQTVRLAELNPHFSAFKVAAMCPPDKFSVWIMTI